MFDWLKDYDKSRKEVYQNLPSKFYENRIKYCYFIWILDSVGFAITALVCAIKLAWWGALFPLLMILMISCIFYKGIKGLKENYNKALLREAKQKEEQEKKNENNALPSS